jgi:hypothetical protein
MANKHLVDEWLLSNQVECQECAWEGASEDLMDEGACPVCSAPGTAISDATPDNQASDEDVDSLSNFYLAESAAEAS